MEIKESSSAFLKTYIVCTVDYLLEEAPQTHNTSKMDHS